MAPRHIESIEALKGLIGEHLGYSEYMDVSQERVNKFAEATGDFQWIHIDVEKANAVTGTLFVEIPLVLLETDNTKINIEVHQGNKVIETITTNFLGPRTFN